MFQLRYIDFVTHAHYFLEMFMSVFMYVQSNGKYRFLAIQLATHILAHYRFIKIVNTIKCRWIKNNLCLINDTNLFANKPGTSFLIFYRSN